MNFDEALLPGELDTVANKVKEDLVDSSPVTPDPLKHKRLALINDKLKFDFLLVCLELNDLKCLLNDLNQINMLIVHGESCRFHFCKVKEIIYQVNESIGRKHSIIKVKLHLLTELKYLIALLQQKLGLFAAFFAL